MPSIAELLNLMKWKAPEAVEPLAKVPSYITSGYGDFMRQQADRAKHGDLGTRDLLKAYGITMSSMQRQARNVSDDLAQGLTRPEGYMAEWLRSDKGQAYLRDAERGVVNEDAIKDLQQRFRTFGFHNKLADDLRYAATALPAKGGDVNSMVLGGPVALRDFTRDIKGIAEAKPGFIGSLLGNGSLPTADARQLIEHTEAPIEAAKLMSRKGGKVGTAAVDELANRQRAWGTELAPEYEPFRQHLIHHGVWDRQGGTQTTHGDLIKTMSAPAVAGATLPAQDSTSLRALAQPEGGGAFIGYPSMQRDAKRLASIQAPESVTDPAYAKWARNYDDAEKFTLLSDLALSAAPGVGPAARALGPKAASMAEDMLRRQGLVLDAVGFDKPPRLSAAESRAQGYFHPAAGDKRLPIPVSQIGETVTPFKTPAAPIITPEDLQGGVAINLSGDPSRIGTVREIAGSKLDKPVKMQAGAGYMDLNAGIDSPVMWANNLSPARAIQNRVNTAGESGAPVYGVYSRMGPASLGFNQGYHDVVRRLMHDANMLRDPATVAKFDAEMRALRPDWPGLGTRKADQLLKDNGTVRNIFMDRLGQDYYQSHGAPNLGVVRYALTDPALRDTPLGFAGHRVAEMRPGAPLVADPPIALRDFPVGLEGRRVGQLVESLPPSVMWRDWAKQRAAAGLPVDPRVGATARSLSLSNPVQKLDQEWVDNAMKYVEALKKAGGAAAATGMPLGAIGREREDKPKGGATKGTRG